MSEIENRKMHLIIDFNVLDSNNEIDCYVRIFGMWHYVKFKPFIDNINNNIDLLYLFPIVRGKKGAIDDRTTKLHIKRKISLKK